MSSTQSHSHTAARSGLSGQRAAVQSVPLTTRNRTQPAPGGGGRADVPLTPATQYSTGSLIGNPAQRRPHPAGNIHDIMGAISHVLVMQHRCRMPVQK